ncbi:hypothetical protein M758_UG140600 [Ceratodon purpureus]|nr:hypothetical protein M758_UG140600 [Ceratodon purpureus]
MSFQRVNQLQPPLLPPSPFIRRAQQTMPCPAQIAPQSTAPLVGAVVNQEGNGVRGQGRPRSPGMKECKAMAKRRASALQNESYAVQRIAHAEGRQISDANVEVSPQQSWRSRYSTDQYSTPDHEAIKFANPYDVPNCSNWVTDATTEYGATET